MSSPQATPPGRCHSGALANEPRCNLPYCQGSGRAKMDSGRPPSPRSFFSAVVGGVLGFRLFGGGGKRGIPP